MTDTNSETLAKKIEAILRPALEDGVLHHTETFLEVVDNEFARDLQRALKEFNDQVKNLLIDLDMAREDR